MKVNRRAATEAEDSLRVREGSRNTVLLRTELLLLSDNAMNSFRRRDHGMTTYRRFSCNDLLRLGALNLEPDTSTHPIESYLGHMAIWPGNCILADAPGGRITGYIFGKIEGTDEDTTGSLSVLKFSTDDTAKVMSSMLEAACDKLYHANGMKVILEADCKEAISGCVKLGYSRYRSDSESVVNRGAATEAEESLHFEKVLEIRTVSEGVIAMTTYRRFSCNDLLRLGATDLDTDTSTDTIRFYLRHLAKWPGNCIVADTAGGEIVGYIFGTIEGIDEDTTGRLSMLKFPTDNMARVMSSLLEAACDKLYHANGMKAILRADCKEAISGCAELGYSRYKGDSECVEMHKKFRLILIRDTENFNDVAESTSYD